MVQPKTIGKTVLKPEKSPGNRRQDLQVVVPVKNEIRNVEAFDATPATGVQEIITADNSTFHFLRLCRIFLTGENTTQRILGKEEAIYYVNRGTAILSINGATYTLGKGDVLYVGIDSQVDISANEMLDLSEFKAVLCHTAYPVQLVRHTDIEGTELAAHLGTRRPMSERTVFKLVDKNV